MITRKSKYAIVGERTAGMSGKLLDIGARDRVLEGFLDTARLEYLSADVSGDPRMHMLVDLEKPIECADGAFDVVAALDVLEHVEGIHAAFRELLRITRGKLFVSLPNMSCLSFRLNFMLTGGISGKYSLLPEHQGDRHRWLTGYRQAREFIERNAAAAGCGVEVYDIVSGFGTAHEIISRLPAPPSLRTYTLLFEITKRPGGAP